MLICKGALLAENKWVAIFSFVFSVCHNDYRLDLVFSDRFQQVSDDSPSLSLAPLFAVNMKSCSVTRESRERRKGGLKWGLK